PWFNDVISRLQINNTIITLGLICYILPFGLAGEDWFIETIFSYLCKINGEIYDGEVRSDSLER
ncbi:TPA: hypothetical protein ACGF6Q_003332, partial [Vibrio cholerae]